MTSGNPRQDFDLIVIGAGSGGLAASFRAATHGARVALLAEGPLGGTCVNVGCVPKKAMWLAADLGHRIELARQLGFALPEPPPALDWPAFITHRQRYITNIHASYQQRLDAAGIAVLPQRGQLVSVGTVECADGVRLHAPQVLIATGGRPQRPAIPGAELAIDSDGFFRLNAAPARVGIVGAGYISVELAGMLQALGSRVEILVRRRRLLESFDEDLTTQLVEDQRQHGIHTRFGFELQSLRADLDGAVVLRDMAGNETDAFDTVILATGRSPASDHLGLERVGVACDPRGHIVVDAMQRTNVAGIHAIGDVTQNVALTPVAIAAGRRLMDRLFGGKPDAALDFDDIATVVFTHPPIGKVGLTEAEARSRHGESVRIYRAGFRPMLHALADSPQRSLFKLVCVGEDERVVGIHLLGEGADEILQGFAVAMKRGLCKRDLDDTVAIHPTSAEELVLMR
jgi:Pyruvate/2-oxoglutarate dehydrogenase complex, dihydrolipoamide dehydrogenase (E3) component, and related enzymes